MDTVGGCADSTSAPGAKKRPDMTGGWTGEKKNKTTVHGFEGGGCEANCTAVVRSRKRSYEPIEHELDVESEKLFKCNYWEDPAYANRLQYFGLELARSAALDVICDSLHREHEAWMAEAAPKPTSN